MKNNASTTNAKPGRPTKTVRFPKTRFSIKGLYNTLNPTLNGIKTSRVAKVTIAAKVKSALASGQLEIVETRNEANRRGRPTNIYKVRA